MGSYVAKVTEGSWNRLNGIWFRLWCRTRRPSLRLDKQRWLQSASTVYGEYWKCKPREQNNVYQWQMREETRPISTGSIPPNDNKYIHSSVLVWLFISCVTPFCLPCMKCFSFAQSIMINVLAPTMSIERAICGCLIFRSIGFSSYCLGQLPPDPRRGHAWPVYPATGRTDCLASHHKIFYWQKTRFSFLCWNGERR
jgi:hypothetical protein